MREVDGIGGAVRGNGGKGMVGRVRISNKGWMARRMNRRRSDKRKEDRIGGALHGKGGKGVVGVFGWVRISTKGGMR